MFLELVLQLVSIQIFPLVIKLILPLATCLGELELLLFLFPLELGIHSLHLLQSLDKLLDFL